MCQVISRYAIHNHTASVRFNDGKFSAWFNGKKIYEGDIYNEVEKMLNTHVSCHLGVERDAAQRTADGIGRVVGNLSAGGLAAYAQPTGGI